MGGTGVEVAEVEISYWSRMSLRGGGAGAYTATCQLIKWRLHPEFVVLPWRSRQGIPATDNEKVGSFQETRQNARPIYVPNLAHEKACRSNLANKATPSARRARARQARSASPPPSSSLRPFTSIGGSPQGHEVVHDSFAGLIGPHLSVPTRYIPKQRETSSGGLSKRGR